MRCCKAPISSLPWSVEKTYPKNTPSQADQHQHCASKSTSICTSKSTSICTSKYASIRATISSATGWDRISRSLFGPAKPCSSPRPCEQKPGRRAGRQRMAATAATAQRRGATRSRPLRRRAWRASLHGRAHEGMIKVNTKASKQAYNHTRIRILKYPIPSIAPHTNGAAL